MTTDNLLNAADMTMRASCQTLGWHVKAREKRIVLKKGEKSTFLFFFSF